MVSRIDSYYEAKPLKIPHFCTLCGGELKREMGVIFWITQPCTNPECLKKFEAIRRSDQIEKELDDQYAKDRWPNMGSK